MLARVFSCAVIGLDGVTVEAEVDAGRGLPKMTHVCLADTTVQESCERVQTAIKNAGFTYPRKLVIVNLAPTSVRKEGPNTDLPIAFGVLARLGIFPQQELAATEVVGELSLDGSVRHMRGVLPMAAHARAKGFKRIFVPATDAPEGALIPNLEVIPVLTLGDIDAHLTGETLIPPQVPIDPGEVEVWVQTDFHEIKGQEHNKHALKVTAAGYHKVLIFGTI